MAGDINIVAIVKGDERYVFMFDDATRAETLRTLGRFASNPELTFSWYDAAVLSQKIRQTACTAAACQPLELADEPVARRSRGLLPGTPDMSGLEFPNCDDVWIRDDPAA